MTPYQQSFEINVGLQSLVVNSVAANRQFAFLELTLVYDKSDQHKTIYDSYNVEVASEKIKSLKIGNPSLTYAPTNEIKYDFDDTEDAYWLYAQFVAFVCNGYTIAPLTDKYFSSDEKMYLDLRRSKGYMDELESLNRDDSKLTLTVTLKDAATKKMRLRVTLYSQGKYYHTLSQRGSIIQCKNYGITKDKNIAA